MMLSDRILGRVRERVDERIPPGTRNAPEIVFAHTPADRLWGDLSDVVWQAVESPVFRRVTRPILGIAGHRVKRELRR